MVVDAHTITVINVDADVRDSCAWDGNSGEDIRDVFRTMANGQVAEFGKIYGRVVVHIVVADVD